MFYRLKRVIEPIDGSILCQGKPTLMLLVYVCILYVISGSAIAGETQLQLSSMEFRRIALVPFLRGKFESPDGKVDKPLNQPLSRIVFDGENLRDNADQVLTRIVADNLKSRFRERLILSEQTKAVFDEISRIDTLTTIRKLAMEIGAKLQAELVVVGSVWRYRDRGAIKDMPDAPASVAFEIYLVEVATGKRLWRNKFDGTQKTLSEDVIGGFKQLKMGVRWLSADELARYGVREVFQKFPIR